MKRIGISQRVDIISGRMESRDALDVRWAELLWSLGYLPILLSSSVDDIDEYLGAMQLDGFILSGGNDIGSAPKRDRLEKAVLKYSERHQSPVLGVCRGMQFINHYLGGHLRELEGHVAIRHELVGAWARDRGYKEVNSYHNLAIMKNTLGRGLIILAQTKDGVIEAMAHKKLPWLGIMWHPERECPFFKNDLHLISKHFL